LAACSSAAFTSTTFMIGDEFATFLAKTQADVKAALEQAAK